MDVGTADCQQNVELFRAHSFQREIQGLVGMQMGKDVLYKQREALCVIGSVLRPMAAAG
jgi:hypothetical protein